MRDILSIKKLQIMTAARSILIWGSGHFGTAILKSLQRNNITVTGFIDTYRYGTTIHNIPVFQPEKILSQGPSAYFIITASAHFSDAMEKQCTDSGYLENIDFITHTSLKPYNFEIEVSDSCNLRCLTCPQGNMRHLAQNHQMNFSSFKLVFDKLLGEYPLLGDIQLYSWGEPLLNKDLPRIISYANSHGVSAAVSSNLSLKADLEAIIKANPTWFRISLSGYGESMYSKNHVGGKWELVKNNMKQLSLLRDTFSPSTFIEVNYHVYNYNIDGIEPMRNFCENIGLSFHPNYAFLDPLDILFSRCSGVPLPPEAEQGCKNLVIEIDAAIEIGKKIPGTTCVAETSLVIQSNLSVLRCNHIFANPANIIAPNFLETPLTEIIDAIPNSSLCKQCKELGLNRYHFAYLEEIRGDSNAS
jgi:pyruvate-formate lyase-activating enzyme